jgi:hypothetical protein
MSNTFGRLSFRTDCDEADGPAHAGDGPLVVSLLAQPGVSAAAMLAQVNKVSHLNGLM